MVLVLYPCKERVWKGLCKAEPACGSGKRSWGLGQTRSGWKRCSKMSSAKSISYFWHSRCSRRHLTVKGVSNHSNHFGGNRLLSLTKMHFWKGAKKLGRALPPLIWTKSQRTAVFFVTPSHSVDWIGGIIPSYPWPSKECYNYLSTKLSSAHPKSLRFSFCRVCSLQIFF